MVFSQTDDKMWYIHVMVYSAIERKEVLISVTTSMKLGNRLSERTQTAYYMILFI